VIDDAEKFSVSIDARNFAPDEITVSIEGKELKIGAVHIGDPKDGRVTKQFERRYIIPNDVVTDRNETSVSPDGILTVTLPKKRLPP
ncbi:unnamed protein product, partial [Gongylonema pulchrum]|uniref:SHSP domain-containing protein n=1 Tax=Gongylonema pulchrum TaxID=637853 RepID=A0A183D5U3_9BILA